MSLLKAQHVMHPNICNFVYYKRPIAQAQAHSTTQLEKIKSHTIDQKELVL